VEFDNSPVELSTPVELPALPVDDDDDRVVFAASPVELAVGSPPPPVLLELS
jgi:hypothetical protein